jgi:NADPH-dependent 2,4-dienoyl-CoA reductase/sulfur reductase-like enzyme/rhodanese-related sulfurtransferase
MKIVIVGGVAGGASAAARARRLDEHAEIVLLERGPDVSFANCGLPYYLSGEITERAKLLVTPLERLRQRYKLDARPLSEVTSIDIDKHEVEVRDVATGTINRERFDKLILSPGAAPRMPGIPGQDLPGVHSLRSLQDADRVMARLHAGVKHAVIMGGGFIGLEMAECLAHRGVGVTLIERNPQVLMALDAEIARPVADELATRGVNVLTQRKVTGIQSIHGLLRVTMEGGESIDAGLVVIGIGVTPESDLAQKAGLALGKSGGIKVDRHMRTSHPDIYAVGDAVETPNIVTGELAVVALGGPANRQGRIAAAHAMGRAESLLDSSYRGSQGTAIVRVFGRTAGCTGASERMLKRLNIAYKTATVHPAHHAGYYPGAEGMTLKVVFAPDDGRILGAQAVGGAGVDKRLDVLAMAIQGKMTVYNLEEAELCYAPPFGSAKDPVNMAGFVASGLLRGDHPQITAAELRDHITASTAPTLVDVRTAAEFERGTVPGAINLPVDELRTRLGELKSVAGSGPVVVFCQVGMRGYLATRILLQNGFSARNVSGGYTSWTRAI